MAISIYTLSCFKLPETVIEEIQRAILQFWWGQKRSENRMQWIRWRISCRLKMQRGLNFKDLKAFNLAILTKQGWKLVSRPNSLINKVFQSKYYRYSNFLRAEVGHNPSWDWRSIIEGRKVLKKGILCEVGRRINIRIREDSWVKDYVSITPITTTAMTVNLEWVSQLQNSNKTWNQNLIQTNFNLDIATAILNTPIHESEDRVTWMMEKGGDFTVASGYKIAFNFYHPPIEYLPE
ncbi:uncharacterized protein LOC107620875 [Arachis ipaensis]|uniref:uncharacterized protein LOC107620875 n=1 Tax=Arachis ipaensis TaxID=130454 RepID=UPI0007AFDEDC|nr:uncharacterized protein LOC107620875 [Arachis ipaensis]